VLLIVFDLEQGRKLIKLICIQVWKGGDGGKLLFLIPSGN
jgi:hypothetical protein